ncbi:MAG: hypothetical protein A2854_00740 [Parcubacteria group bacterium RIFCSPHIGHO2_01_FULL_56_18]|nr:MAG: hypothetical protein A2854_00740 [Parcubacteria group bacterium RIFCSPHIGHO2_01_FULL_56_18]
MRVSLLSTADSLILGYIIEAFLRHAVPIHSILLDPKPVSEHDRAIFLHRTAGKMPPIPLTTFKEAKLTVFSFPSHLSDECTEFVRENAIDILVNAGTPRILSPAVLRAPSMGVLNCHPGVLPQYRGCSCVEWALYNNDPVGNTVHFMTKEIDRGHVVRTEIIALGENDSYEDIRIKTYLGGFDLLARCIRDILAGTVTMKDFALSGEGTYHKPMPEDLFRQLMTRMHHAKE